MNMGAVVEYDVDQRWLRAKQRPERISTPTVRSIDLFCGCGAMSVGLEEGARRHGLGLDVALAVDTDPDALDVFKSNFPEARTEATDMNELFAGAIGERWPLQQRVLRTAVGKTYILQAGPPCQGHSDLNNRTRRRDPKNALYRRVARAAELFEPAVVVIENVPSVQRDAANVVNATRTDLEALGYDVAAGVVDASLLGVPQRRKRFIMIASSTEAVDVTATFARLRDSERLGGVERDLSWAIGDLVDREGESDLDRPSRMSQDNQARVQYLFENDLYELPDSQRPVCHQDGNHSYRAVYGRLRWGDPAPTITTGFTSMGQGRFVHPSRRRTLTPHEAARLQTIPDWFDWQRKRRTALSTMIGNAVPVLMMAAIGETLFGTAAVSRDSVARSA